MYLLPLVKQSRSLAIIMLLPFKPATWKLNWSWFMDRTAYMIYAYMNRKQLKVLEMQEKMFGSRLKS